MVVGRYAEILPWDFDEAPTEDFAEHALPLFVPYAQAAGVALPEAADLSAPPGQQRAFFRLHHLLFRMEDAALALPWRGKAQGDQLPLCAVIGLTDPAQPIADAVSASGAGAIDLDVIPLLAAPLWELAPKERDEIAGRLPFVPPG
ncbi:hypothetical protein [Sphingopyxis sp. JAI128]|uniref:hypothetical protein n=1 Tax=Sphingopyxis sp. JAI128 TaxID=2723066 RepID=UPI0016131F91|nr:hypothetical protein [Sphingopyxis sp. JAI128]MBB6424634.1 hypothetical protein [Sphingopyxis sp. JAI128]